MSTISQLLESSRTIEDKVKILDRLEQKWAPTGLLEGTAMKQHTYDKKFMALLLENQNKQILVEQQTTNNGGANFTAGTGEQWAGIVLPMVRKVFAEISAKEFLSTQPMSMPYGLVFYLDFQYANQEPYIGSGANSRFNIGSSVYGTTNVPGADPFGGLYGAGKFGFSLNTYNALVASGSMTIATASVSGADTNYNGNVSASVAAAGFRKVTINSASVVLPGFDAPSVRSFVFTGSGINETVLFPEFTSYNSTFDQLSFIVTGSLVVSASSNIPNANATVYYSKQTNAAFRGDYEDTNSTPLTGSNSITEIDISPSSSEITARSRKLKYSYTQEAQQDYNAFQSIDIEAEATSMLSEYISREIDLELIDLVDQAAVQTVEVWSALNNRTFDLTTNTWSQNSATTGTGYYNSQQDWFQTLGTKMQKVSRAIHAKTQRGEANVAMVSPKVAAIIESIAGYAAGTDGSKMEYAFGGKEAGKLNGKFKILVNSYMQENAIIMGYKGANYLDSGGVFAPYIPLISTPLIFNPDTFKMSKGLSTRFGRKILRPEFFGKVLVADFNSF